MPRLAKLGYLCKTSLFQPLVKKVVEQVSFVAHLQRVYDMLDNAQPHRAQALLLRMSAPAARTQPAYWGYIRRRSAAYYQAQGDVSLCQNNGTQAQAAYTRALEQTPSDFLRLKLAVASMPCYHTDTAAARQRASSYLSQVNKSALPAEYAELTTLLQAQMQPVGSGIETLRQLAIDTQHRRYLHVLAAGELLGQIPELPHHSIWSRLIAGLYGDPDRSCPHPREIGWRLKTALGSAAVLNCASVALDRALALNPELSSEQKIQAVSYLHRHTSCGSQLHRWAADTLQHLRPHTSLPQILPQPTPRKRYTPLPHQPRPNPQQLQQQIGLQNP